MTAGFSNSRLSTITIKWRDRLAALGVGVAALVLLAPDASWANQPRASGREAHESRAERSPSKVAAKPRKSTSAAATQPARPREAPEARLIEIYRLIGAERTRDALVKAEALVADVPNFQLAQLVYADLLSAQTGYLKSFGAVSLASQPGAAERLQQLRDEARQRLLALRERPAAGSVPHQFVELPLSSRHAIAVDASRSRLYLFENSERGLKLIGDYYVSLGKMGMEKNISGDQRTPVGVYFITSRLDARQLTDFYGAGALPLNYPNEYDRRLGRTGSGIWLHGVPSVNYTRSPNSTDGCVVLANPDLDNLLKQVEPRATPVLITNRIEWIKPEQIEPEKRRARNLIEGWRGARESGDLHRAMAFYSAQFANGTQDVDDWRATVTKEVAAMKGRPTQIKDLSVLTWRDKSEIMIVTFGEVLAGQRTGPIKRQYWGKEGGIWKIFFEGVIG